MNPPGVSGNRSLAARLRLALGVVAGLMALASLGLLFMAHRGAEEARSLYTRRLLPMSNLEQVAEAYVVRMTVVLREVRSGRTPPAEGRRRLREARADGERAWAAYPPTAEGSADPSGAQARLRLETLRRRSFELEEMLGLGMSGDLGTFGDSKWLPDAAAFIEALEPLRASQRAAAEEATRLLAEENRRFALVGSGLILLALALAWGSGHVLSRRLTEGAGELVARIEGLARGDLEPRPGPAGEDEWARAARSLEAMAGRLKELMQAQEAQQALQDALLDGAQAAVISLDSEGKVNRFNRQAEVLLGYSAQEVVGKATPLLWRVPEELDELTRELSQKLGRPLRDGLEALQTFVDEDGTVSECHYRHRDGTLIPVALGRSRVRTADGRILGTMGVAMDLRPLKQLEAELRASEVKYRRLVDRIPGVVVQARIRPEGGVEILFAGSAFQSLLGISAADFARDPEPILNCLSPEDLALLHHLGTEALRTGSSFQWDGRLALPGGVRWIRSRANPQPQADGSVVWDALLEDQTDLLEAENALAHSEERWQLALEANRDGIWDLDPVQGQVWFSPRWKEILGYGEEELPDVLATFEDRIHPAELAEVQGRFRAFLAGEAHTYSATFRMRHRDGSWRWILSRGSAVRDAQGRVIRVVGSHADITEQRAIESTLRESEARAQAASRAKSSFLANMSHELRTPLSAILG
ncbi:MAG TPA: PAS domain S-box protein, partial [Holophagaceae bacterium]|nr:PAS domain S-box protein [Holophagaceae bacterium]